MSHNFPIIRHCKLFQWQAIFYFFGRSTDNSDLYVHVLILLKLVNYSNKIAVAFLIVFLERQCLLFHSWVVCQHEFWWLVCFHNTAYNTNLTFLLEYKQTQQNFPLQFERSSQNTQCYQTVLTGETCNTYPSKLAAERFIAEKKVLLLKYKVLIQTST